MTSEKVKINIVPVLSNLEKLGEQVDSKKLYWDNKLYDVEYKELLEAEKIE